MGSRLGLSEDPVLSRSSPRTSASPTPAPVVGLLGSCFEDSLEHQARNRSAVPRESPHPSPRDTLGLGRGGGTWGTIWRALSRGRRLAPSSADPHSRRSTSPCPAGLRWGRDTGLDHTRSLVWPGVPPLDWSQGSQVAFSSRAGLSGVICEPWGLPLALAITWPGIFLGIHMHPVSQTGMGGTMLGALARIQVCVGEGDVGGRYGEPWCPPPCTSAPP